MWSTAFARSWPDEQRAQAAISRLITPHMNQEVKVVFGDEHRPDATAAERWNGVLPTTLVPGSAVPFLNVH